MPEPSPESVRRSLRALTDGSAPTCLSRNADPAADRDTGRPDIGLTEAEAEISDAEEAVSCACAGAKFVAGGRLSRLDAATRTAARRDAAELARRGRIASATLRRLDTVLSGHGDSSLSAGVASDTDGPPSSDRDHFHSTRGTVLGHSGQDPGR